MLGVCYYPEHWDEAWWEDDAARMAALGISHVRIGEFAWSVIEPDPGRFTWDWLDRALTVLHRHGLKVILGTPTATPPKWLIDRHPEILPVDAKGRPRGFGSRRHYDFSSPVYAREAARIVEAMARRYGRHDAVVGWQTDNEYGCHDTVRSYSPAARAAFRDWLARRYQSPDALNRAWGNRFWSMELGAFDEVELPNLTVTEANPSHRLAFARFASDQVRDFNRMQTAIIRAHSPGRWITHNYMGAFTDFDHFDVGEDLDLASWDSYPLGFTDVLPHIGVTQDERLAYAETGHPDMAAFHHDLYRAVGKGRWMVMEQQPGPVNWAAWNPAPRAGHVRLWTWEALAHGAEIVSYFRWRQAPFAQEQMHAGLNRPDRVLDTGGEEAEQVAKELKSDWWRRGAAQAAQAPVALLFDYPSIWATEIQKQGADYHPLAILFEWYQALRRRGLNIDFVRPGESLEGYKLAVAPCLLIADEAARSLDGFEGVTVLGPRSGSKTPEYAIPATLPPGRLTDLAGVKVTRVESLRPGLTRGVSWNGDTFQAHKWAERLELSPGTRSLASFADGTPAIAAKDRTLYAGLWPSRPLLDRLIGEALDRAGLSAPVLPEGLRLRRLGALAFAFNSAREAKPLPAHGVLLMGSDPLPPSEVAVWHAVDLPGGMA